MTERTLTEAEEAILSAVSQLKAARTLPGPGRIGLHTSPPMTTAEVMLSAGRLARDGYLTVHENDGAMFYDLTDDGDNHVSAINSRGTLDDDG